MSTVGRLFVDPEGLVIAYPAVFRDASSGSYEIHHEVQGPDARVVLAHGVYTDLEVPSPANGFAMRKEQTLAWFSGSRGGYWLTEDEAGAPVIEIVRFTLDPAPGSSPGAAEACS